MYINTVYFNTTIKYGYPLKCSLNYNYNVTINMRRSYKMAVGFQLIFLNLITIIYILSLYMTGLAEKSIKYI